jgi:hypothetical protein
METNVFMAQNKFTTLKTMPHLIDKSYCYSVRPGTRDHKGLFLQETTYTLTTFSASGWARICLDSSACYYVDPDSLFEILEE